MPKQIKELLENLAAQTRIIPLEKEKILATRDYLNGQHDGRIQLARELLLTLNQKGLFD